ncbi:MAG: beta-N-acetylhexosaminidase [Chitinivorax sp.]
MNPLPNPHPLGPVMVDIAGKQLTDHERERLLHPLVGGVILFARNFESIEQLQALTAEIHALRRPPLLIAVDHEGGRVQRFKQGFTRIPPMRELGAIWEQNQKQALQLAEWCGWILAAELRACGVDFSFTPVLDLDFERCAVIGNRAFHRDPAIVAQLVHALQIGLRKGGMPTVGKHFPGHGYVNEDSHHEVPVDQRALADLQRDDIDPYVRLIPHGLTAVMPAHVIYPQIDSQPAGFSRVWLHDILRQQLGFDGVIFSDDLCMEGASVAGESITARALAALEAGCDMVLVCNRPDLADELLQKLHWQITPVSLARLGRMHGHPHPATLTQLHEDPHFAKAVHEIGGIGLASADLPFPPVGEA